MFIILVQPTRILRKHSQLYCTQMDDWSAYSAKQTICQVNGIYITFSRRAKTPAASYTKNNFIYFFLALSFWQWPIYTHLSYRFYYYLPSGISYKAIKNYGLAAVKQHIDIVFVLIFNTDV